VRRRSACKLDLPARLYFFGRRLIFLLKSQDAKTDPRFSLK
jgi:hypothetical protein